jgi:hypothetical protein
MPVRALRLARGFVETLAPTVSVAWFIWVKPPGNLYLTFYPTRMLPQSPDSLGWRDTGVAHQIFDAVVRPGDEAPRPLTLGYYGGTRLQIPGWAGATGPESVWPPPRTRPPLQLRRGLTTMLSDGERRSLRWLLATLDVDWLRSRGSNEPRMTSCILEWTDRCIEELQRNDAAEIRMRFEETAMPSKLRFAEIRETMGKPTFVPWPSLQQETFTAVWYATSSTGQRYRTLGVIIRGEIEGPRAYFSSGAYEDADKINRGIDDCLGGDDWTRERLFEYFAERTNGYTIEVSKPFAAPGYDLDSAARTLVWSLDDRNRRLGFEDGYSPADTSPFQSLPFNPIER